MGQSKAGYVAVILPSGFLCLLRLFYGYFVIPEVTQGH